MTMPRTQYEVTINVGPAGIRTIIAPTRLLAARIAYVAAWAQGYTGDEVWFILTPRVSSAGWNSPLRTFSVTVTRVKGSRGQV